MTRSKSIQSQDSALLTRALAAIISNTRSKSRALSLTAVCKWLDVAVARLGSIAAVADRVSISPKMLGQFHSVGRLTQSVRELFSSRLIDSVDAATHLAMLSPKEQEAVARALVADQIDTTDVRAVVQLRKAGSTAGIRPLLSRVRKSKTKQEYVAEFVIRGTRTRDELLHAFHKYVHADDILRLEIDGSLGRLVLSKRGKDALLRAGRTLGIPAQHTIPTLLGSQFSK
jgi:hypothetical protein